MIIDIHNHPDWDGITCDKMIEDMDKNGIDKTWLLSCEIPESEYDPLERSFYTPIYGRTAIPFIKSLPYIEKYPDRFVLGYAPDPREWDAIDKLKSAVKHYGVKVCGEVKYRMMADDYDAINMWRWCGENGLPVLIHLQYPEYVGRDYPRSHYWYSGGIDALERAMKAAPDTIFIGHALAFWSAISNDEFAEQDGYPQGKVIEGGKLIKMLDKYQNLYCDLSAGSGLNALKRDTEFAKKFLVDYQDRVCYARDQFTSLHKDFIMSLNLEKSVLDKIMFKNALKLVHEKE